MPASQPLASQETSPSSEAAICRICLEQTPPFIAPCLCRGSARFVHRSCLDEWRAQQGVALAFTHCSVCRFEYEVTDEQPEPSRLMRFRLHVARDTALLFVIAQTVIAAFAVILHALDRAINCPQQSDWTVPCNTSVVSRIYPRQWSDRTSIVHLSLGPYYVSSVLILLAMLGVLGVVLAMLDKLPRRVPVPEPSAEWQRVSLNVAPLAPALEPGLSRLPGNMAMARAIDEIDVEQDPERPPELDQKAARARAAAAQIAEPSPARGRRHGSSHCCRGSDCNCNGNESNCCLCPSDCSGSDCKCDGEGALALALVAFVIFVLVGIFVGVFFATIAIQRIVQRHIHILNMRTAAQRFPVKDLGATPCGSECHEVLTGRA